MHCNRTRRGSVLRRPPTDAGPDGGRLGGVACVLVGRFPFAQGRGQARDGGAPFLDKLNKWQAKLADDRTQKTRGLPPTGTALYKTAKSYARALSTIGRSADRICFVAAHPSDLRAARAHGMKTAHVVARLHDYGDEHEDRGFSTEFHVVADNFTDLAGRMKA